MRAPNIFLVSLALFCITTSAGYAQLPAESEWELTNVSLFQRSKATLKNADGAINLTMHLRGGRNLEYTGQLSGTRLILKAPYTNSGSTEKARKCHEYIMNNPAEFPEYNYVLELQQDSTENFSGKLHQPTGIICDDEGVVTKIEIQTSEIRLKRIKAAEFTLYTQKQDSVEITANFSNPFPAVRIAPGTIRVSGSSGGRASVSFSATVTDALADIVENAADIREVYLEYLDPLSETLEVSKTLSVQKSSLTTTKWQPYAHEINVDVNETVPLIDTETYVNIRAVNAVGNETVASVIILAGEGSSGQFTYRSHRHNDGTGSGYANPIQVHLSRPNASRPSGDEIEEVDITYGGRTLEMVPDPDKPEDFYLKTPLIALDSIPLSLQNSPNIVAVDANDVELKYKDETRDLYWNYTAHSPSNIYTYAIGLTYTHNIYSRKFNTHTLVEVLGIYDQDSGAKLIDKSNIRLAPNPIRSFNGIRGRSMSFKIPYRRDLVGKTVAVKCVLRNNKGKRYRDNMGVFKIGTLKTIVVGVDGLSYKAANAIVTADKERGFKFAFNKDGRDNGIFKQTLSAIPTITWCNWSGIYSGQPPGKHGITGNSFLKFNSSKIWINNKVNQLVGAVISGLGDNAHETAGSFYDEIAKVYPNASRKLNVYSAYPWYAKSEDDNVSVSASGYTKTFLKFWTRPSSPELFGHDPDAARRLDLATAYIFKNKIADELLEDDGYDVVSLYYPGPDNIAHYLGKGDYDKSDLETETDTIDFEPGLTSVHYSIKPNTIDVNTPLKSVEEHLKQVTDFYFDRNVRFLRKNGLSYSTMFVLTADHSLHAYHNDSEGKFNIFPEDMIDLVRKHLIDVLQQDRKLRRGRDFYTTFKKEQARKRIFSWNTTTVEVFVNSVVNYSPNGGMGHLYVRTGSSKMDNILLHESAKLLYMATTKGAKLNGKSSKLSPKRNKANNGNTDSGAFGKTPAIFIKACPSLTSCEGRLRSNYRWVKNVSSLNGTLTLGTIDEFLRLSGHRGKWLDFEARLEELNDKSETSRSGDIVMFTDGAMGYLTVIHGDEYNGWHGGATLSESVIPMFINIPGTIANEDFIKKGVESANRTILQNSPKSSYMRNWHLMQVLKAVYTEMRR